MRSLRVYLIMFAVLASALVGCREDDSIRSEIVTHAAREPIHLRVAFFQHDELMWFFRLSGPETQVMERLPAFESLVRSVRFDDKKEPTWTVPKDWQKDPPAAMRYAGYRIAAEPKELEVLVTRLQAEGFGLMDNMHRWQKFVNLPLSEKAADNERYLKRDKIAGLDVTWVAMTGLGVHTVSKPPAPMADNKKKFLPPIGLQRPPPAGGGDLPFQFVLPGGWVQKKPRSFITHTLYVVANKEQEAEVTLTVFKLDGGGVAENINRWRKEVQLPRLPDNEAARSADTFKVADVQSFYVDLENPKGPPTKNRILGVILPLGHETWFVKMTGPHDWVGQNKNAFETFVKSFKKIDAR